MRQYETGRAFSFMACCHRSRTLRLGFLCDLAYRAGPASYTLSSALVGVVSSVLVALTRSHGAATPWPAHCGYGTWP